MSTTIFHQPKNTFASPFAAAPQRKTMSITQTYFLAHKARAKLSTQAARPDHNLRLLVGHANLLDTLMLELADAEREQESWFNQSVQQSHQPAPTPATPTQPERRVQWAETIVEDPEEDWQAEDADNDSASDVSSDDYSDSDDGLYDDSDDDDDSASSIDDDAMADAAPLARMASRVNVVEVCPDSDDDDEDIAEDDEAHEAHLTLTRSASHSLLSPPELVDGEDSDDVPSDDDDAAMPPSPPSVAIPSFGKDGTAPKPARIAPTSPQQQDADPDHDDEHEHDDEHDYFLPPRNPARLLSLTAY